MSTQPHALDSDNSSLRDRWLREAFPVGDLLADLRATLGPTVRLNLRDWFQPDNEVAAKIGTAAILREDLAAVRFDAIDAFEGKWRQEDARPHLRREQHNLRATTRALGDILQLLNILSNNSREWSDLVGPVCTDNLRRVTLYFSTQYKIELESHRNQVGGHFRWTALGEGLPSTAAVDIAELELRDIPHGPQHWYATQLSIVAFLRTVPNEHWEATFKAAVARAMTLSSIAVRVLDWLILDYIKRSGLSAAP